MRPPEIPVLTQVIEEKADADTARFIIVLSKKGSMLRLHRSDGCSKAQTLSFASYEFCDLDPVPPTCTATTAIRAGRAHHGQASPRAVRPAAALATTRPKRAASRLRSEAP